MALDVFFKEDIRNILKSIYIASEGAILLADDLLQEPELSEIPLGTLLRIYRKGFVTALGSIGIAFGLDSASTSHDLLAAHSVTQPVMQTPIRQRQALPAGDPSTANPDASKGSALDDLDLVSFLWVKSQYGDQR